MTCNAIAANASLDLTSSSSDSDSSDPEPAKPPPKQKPKPNAVQTSSIFPVHPDYVPRKISPLASTSNLSPIGTVVNCVNGCVIIHANASTPPLDTGSCLFLTGGLPLGEVYETFGPVITPFYAVVMPSSPLLRSNQPSSASRPSEASGDPTCQMSNSQTAEGMEETVDTKPHVLKNHLPSEGQCKMQFPCADAMLVEGHPESVDTPKESSAETADTKPAAIQNHTLSEDQACPQSSCPYVMLVEDHPDQEAISNLQESSAETVDTKPAVIQDLTPSECQASSRLPCLDVTLVQEHSHQEVINIRQQLTVPEPGDTVYYVPDDLELTIPVFYSHLCQMKGSDASWVGDKEPPPWELDFSDDEEERRHKRAQRLRRKSTASDQPNGLASPVNSDAPPSTSRGRRHNRLNKKPASTAPGTSGGFAAAGTPRQPRPTIQPPTGVAQPVMTRFPPQYPFPMPASTSPAFNSPMGPWSNRFVGGCQPHVANASDLTVQQAFSDSFAMAVAAAATAIANSMQSLSPSNAPWPPAPVTQNRLAAPGTTSSSSGGGCWPSRDLDLRATCAPLVWPLPGHLTNRPPPPPPPLVPRRPARQPPSWPGRFPLLPTGGPSFTGPQGAAAQPFHPGQPLQPPGWQWPQQTSRYRAPQ